MNNQEWQIIPQIINFNTGEPVFYPYSITISKCKRSCNTINDPYAKLCESHISLKTKMSKYLI